MLLRGKDTMLLRNLLIAVLLFFLIILGGVYMTKDFDASLVWPASGFSVALFFIYEKKVWPGIFIGNFLANFVIRFLIVDYPFLAAFSLSFIFSLIALLEAYIFYFILTTYQVDSNINIKRVSQFIFAALISAFAASFLSNAFLLIYLADIENFFTNFFMWFLGNFFGIFIFGSTILLSYIFDSKIIKERILRGIIFFLIYFIFNYLMLSETGGILNFSQHSYLYAIFFILIAPMFSFRATFIFSITYLLMFYHYTTFPIYASDNEIFSLLLDIDFFLATMVIISLIIKLFYLQLEKLNANYTNQNKQLNSLIASTYDLLQLSDEMLTSNKEIKEKYIIRMFDIAIKMFSKANSGVCYIAKDTIQFIESVGFDKSFLDNVNLNSKSFYFNLEKPFLQKNAERELEILFGDQYEEYKATNPTIKESVYFSISLGKDTIGGISLDIWKDSDESFNKDDMLQISAFQSLMNSFHQMHFLSVKNDNLKNDIVLALIRALDLFDKYTKGHSEDVAFLSRALGKRLHLSIDEVYSLYWAGIVHDVGKVGVDSAIINSLEKLTPKQYQEIKLHSTYSYDILNSIEDLKPLAKIVRHHHEWYNGSGYPDGIKGEEIPYLSRVINVTDAVSSMATNRTYRPKLPVEEIISELKKYKGIQFDPEIADEMIKYIEEGNLEDHYQT